MTADPQTPEQGALLLRQLRSIIQSREALLLRLDQRLSGRIAALEAALKERDQTVTDLRRQLEQKAGGKGPGGDNE